MRYLTDDEARQTLVKTLATILRRLLGVEQKPKRRSTSFARQLPAPKSVKKNQRKAP